LDVPVPEEMDGDVRDDVLDVDVERGRYDGKVETKRAVREVVGELGED
jgi:hypothetical protein